MKMMNCPFHIGQRLRTHRAGWSGDDVEEVIEISDDWFKAKLIDFRDPMAVQLTGDIQVYQAGWSNYAPVNER